MTTMTLKDALQPYYDEYNKMLTENNCFSVCSNSTYGGFSLPRWMNKFIDQISNENEKDQLDDRYITWTSFLILVDRLRCPENKQLDNLYIEYFDVVFRNYLDYYEYDGMETFSANLGNCTLNLIEDHLKTTNTPLSLDDFQRIRKSVEDKKRRIDIQIPEETKKACAEIIDEYVY